MASASATVELEAAIAGLPAKKQRLQESFDRLVASAPIPIPFTWDDINAHISSLQSSINVRFLKLQSLQAEAPTTTDPVGHRGNEDQKPHLEHHVRGNEEEGAISPSGRNAEEEGKRGMAEQEIEASLDQDDDVEGEASPDQDEDVDVEAIEASPGLELEEGEENENAKETATASSAYRRNGEMKEIPDLAGGAEEAVRQDLMAACANMDTSMLADVLYWRGKRCLRARRQFLPALLGAAEPHALVVGAVRAFLVRTEPKNDKHWENCVSLLYCARNLTDDPSAGMLEQANRLAQDWKEMIGKPESCRDLGRLALWGLLRFLVSYNLTLGLEFHAHEIINHLANLPRNRRQICIDLCNCLGLIHTMTDSVNHLIENGQELDAIRLACALNLTDEYPPLSIMKEYFDKAKKIAQEILSKNSDSPESLNLAMTKQVNALILLWRRVDEYNIESVYRNSIKAEITRLLHEYAHKRQCLSDASSPALNEEQQEQCRQELQMLEEQLREKQQTKAQDLQPKSEKEHQQQQQQLKQQKAPGQEWSGQNSGEKGRSKKRKRNQYRQQRKQMARDMRQHRFHKQPRLSHAGSFAHSAYNAGPGIRDQGGQRFSGTRYCGPYYRSQTRPCLQTRVAPDGVIDGPN